MTNPAVEPADAASGAPEPVYETDAGAFLADVDSYVKSGANALFDMPERSSEPSPKADAPPPADAPKADTPEPSGDPATPAATPDAIVEKDEVPAEPLTYTVNGQSKSVDWALKVGDEGVVIPPQNIAKLQDLIQRDEWQHAQNRELYAKTQQYEALTHKVGDTEYRGLDAFRQLQAEKAMLDASGGRVMSALADPDFVTNLAMAYHSGDQNQVQAVLAGVLQQVKFAGERAQFDTLRSISQQAEQAAQTQQFTQVENQEYNGLVEQIGKALPALTPDDLREMHDYFGKLRDRIFRPATMQEAQQFGIRPGTKIKDPTVMNEWAQGRAALRQQMAESTKAAQKAAAENTVRQSAKPAAKKAPSRPATPAKDRKPDARFDGDDGSYAAWKKRLEAGKWAHEEMQD